MYFKRRQSSSVPPSLRYSSLIVAICQVPASGYEKQKVITKIQSVAWQAMAGEQCYAVH